MRAAAVCSVCEGALGTSPGHWGYRACHSSLSGGAGVCIRPTAPPRPGVPGPRLGIACSARKEHSGGLSN